MRYPKSKEENKRRLEMCFQGFLRESLCSRAKHLRPCSIHTCSHLADSSMRDIFQVSYIFQVSPGAIMRNQHRVDITVQCTLQSQYPVSHRVNWRDERGCVKAKSALRHLTTTLSSHGNLFTVSSENLQAMSLLATHFIPVEAACQQ
mmetsp:Transcript_34227/g.82760  ORF Transcript_34227/g.82760 Transcript_34227/m.82760 type:complete len:147 (+) Transcript_34227:515-955(+)